MVARRGDLDRAWALIREGRLDSATFRPFYDQVVAELIALSGRWEDVPSFLEGSRAYAAEAGLNALPVHLVRLEARAAVAAGLTDRGIELLGEAGGGFDALGATWERARTQLDLAEALASADRKGEARATVEASAADIERVGALIELDRLRSIRAASA